MPVSWSRRCLIVNGSERQRIRVPRRWALAASCSPPRNTIYSSLSLSGVRCVPMQGAGSTHLMSKYLALLELPPLLKRLKAMIVKRPRTSQVRMGCEGRGLSNDMREGKKRKESEVNIFSRFFSIADLPELDQIRKPGPTNGSHCDFQWSGPFPAV